MAPSTLPKVLIDERELTEVEQETAQILQAIPFGKRRKFLGFLGRRIALCYQLHGSRDLLIARAGFAPDPACEPLGHDETKSIIEQ